MVAHVLLGIHYMELKEDYVPVLSSKLDVGPENPLHGVESVALLSKPSQDII